MKQLTLSNIGIAFDDKPAPIGDRLEILGIDRKTAASFFSKELLDTSVYGSSFLKFFQGNNTKLGVDDGLIPPEPLPADFVNAYDATSKTLGQRLSESGLDQKDISGMFDRDILNLSVSGEEFTDFIVKNQKKFLGKLEQLALSEKGLNASKS